MASFDISKAFDSVNLTSLRASLDRIKVPHSITNLILNLLHERELKIITYYNLTSPLKISNGLDQEETLAPLLWTIFYDPMVHSIVKSSSSKTQILAFMDDVTLLSHSMQSLQQATDIFCSFLSLNSIKCNKKKTNLITNIKTKNLLRKQTLLIEDEPIQPKPYNEAIKYLGIYISGKSTFMSSKNKLKEKVVDFTATIASQKGWNGFITKQASHWIIPAHLDYAIHATIPSENDIKFLQTRMNKAIKCKLGVERTISNKILPSQASLNIIKLQNRCDLTAVKLLVSKLANSKTRPHTIKEIQS